MTRRTAKAAEPQTEAEKAKAEEEALLKKARKGDKTAVDALFARFGPEGTRNFVLKIGNLGRDAEEGLLRNIYGEEDKLLQECGRRRLVEQAKTLAGSNPSPLETLLATRVAYCELVLHYFEALYWQNMKGMSLAASEFCQKRLDRAHRRYLSSIMALAQVRKLLTPAVQVNIGEKQVNMVQTGTQQNLPPLPVPATLEATVGGPVALSAPFCGETGA